MSDDFICIADFAQPTRKHITVEEIYKNGWCDWFALQYHHAHGFDPDPEYVDDMYKEYNRIDGFLGRV